MEKKITKIMGILNVTSDSFFDGGKYYDFEKAVAKGIQLYIDGADIIDIGGESTRPFSSQVTEDEELKKTIPLIAKLKRKIPIPISIDTMKPLVAKAAIEAGASIINDVSGFKDPAMINIARETGVTICVMHMLGNPQNMQIDPHYENGILSHLLEWMKNKTCQLTEAGIKKENIILDPGIGFGKTVEDNVKILQDLLELKCFGLPLLMGISRKSFMGKIVGKKPKDLLSSTLALNTYAILNGVDYIRVHDVLEHSDIVKVLKRL